MVLQASAYFNARTRLPLAKVVIVSGLFLYLRKIRKVRQVGLSETRDSSLNFTTRFATEPVKQLFAVYVKLQKVTVFQ